MIPVSRLVALCSHHTGWMLDIRVMVEEKVFRGLGGIHAQNMVLMPRVLAVSDVVDDEKAG